MEAVEEEVLSATAPVVEAPESPESRKRQRVDKEGADDEEGSKSAEQEDGAKKNDERALKLRFPYSRVKAMIELDPELGKFRKESVKLIAKAAEVFVAHLTQQAWHNTQVAGRKTLKPEDVEKAVHDLDCAEFLRVSFRKE
jgi:histone H3/H4